MKIVGSNGKVIISTNFHEEYTRFDQAFGTSAREFYHGPPKQAPAKIAVPSRDLFFGKLINAISKDRSLWMQEEDSIVPHYQAFLKQVASMNPDTWVPLPKFENCSYTPRPWQVEPIRYALTYKRVMLAIAMGGGKTGVALSVLHHLATKKKKARFLWVSIKSGDLIGQTIQECKRKFKFRHLVPTLLQGKNIEQKAANVEFEDVHGVMYVCNYEMFRPAPGGASNPLIDAFLALEPNEEGYIFDGVVFDESSNLRNHTEHLRGLIYLRGGHWPTYGKTPLFRLSDHIIELSGEPAPQSPTDWCHQMNILHPGILPWNTINAMKSRGAKRAMFGSVKEWSYQFMGELHNRIREFSYVLTKQDLVKLGLNIPVSYSLLKVEMNKHQAKIYKEMEEQAVAAYEREKAHIEDDFTRMMSRLMDNGEEMDIEALSLEQAKATKNARLQSLAQNMLVQILRLSQITGGFLGGIKEYDEWGEVINAEPPQPIPGPNPKLEALIEKVESLKESVETVTPDGDILVESKQVPVVIYARFRHEILLIQEKLIEKGLRVGTIQGSQDSLNARNRDKFMAGELDIIVVNPASGKFGLNLQRASEAIYYGNSFKPEERNQSEGRLARDGQLKNVNITDIVVPHTVDITVLSALKRKKNLSELVLYKLPDLLAGKLSEEEEEALSGYNDEDGDE